MCGMKERKTQRMKEIRSYKNEIGGRRKCSISVPKRSEAVREERSLTDIGGADKKTLHEVTGNKEK